jgi:hypothetical protein
MPDASPAKWHRAHVTWFWEQFLLGEHSPGYKPYHPDYAYLFNHITSAPALATPAPSAATHRPGADEVTAYRKHVDAAVAAFFASADEATLTKLEPLIEVGLNHEQQHQELMFTDILHAFAQIRSRRPTSPAGGFRHNPAPATMGHADGGHPHHRPYRRVIPFR